MMGILMEGREGNGLMPWNAAEVLFGKDGS